MCPRRVCCLLFLMFLRSSTLVYAQERPKDFLEDGVRELAAQLTQAMGGQVKKLAVIEFPDLNGYQSSLGQFIAEELVTYLSAGKAPAQFDVVERRLLARVLKEQELTDSSLFDAASIAKIGKILGIEAIVTGSIADLGSDIKINARAISIETAKVFAAASAKIPKDETVLQLLRQNAGPVAASGGEPSVIRTVAQRNDVYFQNSFLRVDISSVALSKTKDRLTISLILQNTSTQEILLGMASGCAASVVDNSGTVGFLGEGTTGLICVPSSLEDYPKYYTALSPAARTPVVFVFEPRGGKFGGNIFDFSAELLKLDGDGERSFSRFTIGLSGIEVRN